jgi:ankyrin repeat protein
MRKEDEKLFEAARRGDLNEVRDALRQGADPTARAERGHTPLHAAALEGHAEVVGLLIDAGADVNARTSGTKTTPLHSAAGGGHAEVARLLLEHGADPGAKTVEGNTPRALAERWGHADPDLIRSLAEAEERATKPSVTEGRAADFAGRVERQRGKGRDLPEH